MSSKKKVFLQTVVLFIITGLIIWHVVNWHTNGMHLQMFDWTGTNKVYLAVLYNLGLIVVTSTVLSFLMDRISDIKSYIESIVGNENSKD